MGAGKDPLQRQTPKNSCEFEQEPEISRSMAPPANLFCDPDDPAGSAAGAPGGGPAIESGGDGGESLPATLSDLMSQVVEVVGESQQCEQVAEGGEAAAPEPTTDPPNEFVRVNDRTTNNISDAVVTELNTAVDLVRSLTGVDIGTGFGDTTRRLGQGTQKVGADNFSWHKSGRAVDFDQGLNWLIMEDPSGDDMFFRLFLTANDAGAASTYARTFTEEDRGNIHYNGVGSRAIGTPMVDVTAILGANGFERIPAHAGWEARGGYNKREWWHYVNDGDLTWYEALRQIYTEDEIVTAMKALVVVSSRHATGGRLGNREGFPPATLKAIWDNVAITKGKLSLFFSVGSHRNCANIPEDVAAARAAMVSVGIANDPDIAVMISAYQASTGNASPDGYMTVGGGTHRSLGAAMP